MAATRKAESEGRALVTRLATRRDVAALLSIGATGSSLVKLSAERVEELIAAGVGEAFAPAGRVFREWLAVPAAHEASWGAMIDEAWGLVGGTPVHPLRRRRRQDSSSS